MNSISVIIPTYNNSKTLNECLESLKKQTLQPHEIVVVDGHSIDDTIEIAKKHDCRILFEEGGSRAAACNVGMQQVEGDFIAFIDADAIAKEDWLENLISGFEEHHDHKVACVTGPNIEYPNETLFGKAVSAVYDTFIGGNWSEHIQSIFNQEKRYVQSAAGCNALYIKKYLDEVMPFNESLITTEDTDINYRLIQSGYVIYFEPKAIVYHQRPQTHKSYRNKAKKYARGKIQFFRVHKTGLDIGHILPPLYFMTIIFILAALFANYWISLGLAGYFGIYFITLIFTSIIQAIRFREWKFVFMLPSMFLEGHLWWSIGILQEIFLPRNADVKK
ncbi:MAG: glycosyltransferase [Candidatus Heimdallarchaeaceae archaeon]